MPNQFLKLRRSAVPGRIPTTSSLDFGEIALNTYDGLAFMKKSGSSGEQIVTLGTGNSSSFTGSFSGSFTGSLLGTASWAQNSITSSYILNAISASYAATASSAENFTVRGTLTAQTIVAQTITSSTDYITGSSRFGSLLSNTHQFTGSVSVTGSLAVNGSNVVLTNQTSSMSVLSASYAATAALAPNYVLNSSTASMLSPYVLTSVTSSMSVATASYVLNAVSSSFASTASYALSVVTSSLTGSFVTLDTIQTISGSKTFSPNVTAVSSLGIGTTFSPTLSSSANSNTLVGLELTPTFFTGSYTVGSNLALRVRGNTTMYGGTETYDYGLIVYNNPGTTAIFSVRNDQQVSINGALNMALNKSIYTNGIALNNTSTTIGISGGTTQGGIITFSNSGVNHNYTAGNVNIFTIGNPITYAPTSGTGIFNIFSISPVINQTGGANGVTRGLIIAPTLTSASEWRSIETTNNTGYALYLSGSAKSYVSGNFGIGNISPSYSLDVFGTARVSGTVDFIGADLSLTLPTPVSNGENAVLNFWGSSNRFSDRRANIVGYNFGASDRNGLVFQTRNGFGSAANALVIHPGASIAHTNQSYIGINNLSPNVSLDVSGSTRLNGNTQITGSLTVTQGITGSLFGTSSWAQNAITASYITSSNITGIVTSASYALTASYWSGSILNATSASYADTASFAPNYVLNSVTASMLTPYVLTSVTSSMLSPYVLSSSTGSFITNSQTSSMSVLSASYSATASSADNFTVRGTLTAQTIVAQTITSSTDYVTGSTRFGSLLANTHQFTGSVSITGSLSVNGSNAILTNQTGSMSVATASYILNAVSSSYAGTASLAPNYVLNSSTSSMLLPYVLTSVTSSMSVSTASYATTSSLPLRGLITGSVAGATLTFTKGDGTTFDLTVAQSGTVSTASYVTSSGVYGPYGNNSILSSSYALTASYVANASSFPYTGSAIITGSFTVTGSTNVQSLNVGSSQFNNTSSVTSAGTTVISQLATGSYTSCFYNYTIASASNARSGQVMSVWNGVTVRYTEVTTTDIGNTATASFAVAISGPTVRLNFTAPGVWTVKSIANLL